ncbi:hypothetical protein AAHH59_10205 [Pediococcus acidilactici]
MAGSTPFLIEESENFKRSFIKILVMNLCLGRLSSLKNGHFIVSQNPFKVIRIEDGMVTQ